jgi:hypothetical protein
MCSAHLSILPRETPEWVDYLARVQAAITTFLLLVRLFLQRRRGGRRGRATRQLELMLQRANNIDANSLIGALSEEVKVDVVPHAQGPRVRPTPARSDRQFAHVEELVRGGFVGKAAQALCGARAAPPTEETISQLRRLHPPSAAPPGFQFDIPPEARPPPVVQDGRVGAALKKLNTGAAGAWSGWVVDLLLLLFNDLTCRPGLVAILNDLVQGNADIFSGRVAQLLFTRRLLALVKDGGGVRPIAIGEPLVRVAALIALDMIAPHYGELFDSIQLGVGKPAGVERALHLLQAALDKSASSILISVDTQNAFNTRWRHVIWTKLHEQPLCHPVLPLFRLLYSRASDLCVYGVDGACVGVLQSAEGVQQGDPLGHFAYSFSVQHLYKQCSSDVTAVAVADDFSIVAESTAAGFAAFDKYKQDGGAEGLIINSSKCFVLWPRADELPPQDLVDACAARGLQLVMGSAPLLGGRIGDLTDNDTRRWLDGCVCEQKPFADALADPRLHAQSAFLLLRSCLVPRFNYLLRVFPPPVIARAAAAFDRLIYGCLSQRVGALPPPPVLAAGAARPTHLSVAFSQLRLPVRCGGLGIPSAVQVSPAAFIGSSAAALSDICHLFNNDTASITGSSFARRLNDACAQLRVVAPGMDEAGEGHAESTEQLLEKLDRNEKSTLHLQHNLTRLLHESELRRLIQAAQPTDRARLIATSCKGAGVWLSALGPKYGLFMTNSHFILAARHRLGLLPAPGQVSCICNNAAFVADTSHLHSCPRIKAGIDLRHSVLCRELGAVAREAGYSVTSEPHVSVSRADGSEEQKGRADLELVRVNGDGTRVVFVDVSVVHPAAPSYLASSGEEPRELCVQVDQREQSKRGTYVAPAQSVGAQFVPFVLESHGGMGPAAARLLRDFDVDAVGVSTHGAQFGAWARARLSVALQVGNALVSEKGLLRIRHPGSR